MSRRAPFFPVGGGKRELKKIVFLGGECMQLKFPFSDETVAYGHTTGNTPEPVRFQKLSLVRPS